MRFSRRLQTHASTRSRLTVQQVVKLARALEVSTDAILGSRNTADDDALPKAETQALFKTIDAFLKSAHVA
jgi:hypothetical protein